VLAHEPALTQALARWQPDWMPPILEIDAERAWMLMPDFGVALRSLIQSSDDLWHWQRVLPLYAEAQIDLAARLPDLLALGTIDRRLASLPAQYEAVLTDTAAMRIDLPDGLTTASYERLRALTPRFAAMCAELAAYRVPETLQHDDFHDGNIFVRDGRYIFSDWAESCVAHPFFTLVVTLNSIAWRLKLEDNGPVLAQLRDLYLEPWQRYDSPENLLAAFTLARRIGMVNRALTWYRVVSSLEPALREEQAEAVPGWLQEFLDATAASAA
jgi:aminoglycoside phosphotransferase (APT) family kinase protein